MGAATTLERKPSDPAVNPRIGPYDSVHRLDDDGSSSIYTGVSRQHGRPVVIKTFTPRQSDSRDQQWDEAERWLSVMNIVAELCNPPRVHAHLVRVTDSRIFAETSEGIRHYAVMERLHGPSLHTRLKDRKVGLHEIGDYALMIASALDALHEAGVAHGNVNTDNILFLSERSHVLKLVGFGMSSLPLSRHPQAAGEDRAALVNLVKHTLSAQMLIQRLTEEGKRVILRAQDKVHGYKTSTEFARAFQEALPHDEPATEPDPAPSAARTEPPSFLGLPVNPTPKLDGKDAKKPRTGAGNKRKGFWMLSL